MHLHELRKFYVYVYQYLSRTFHRAFKRLAPKNRKCEKDFFLNEVGFLCLNIATQRMEEKSCPFTAVFK